MQQKHVAPARETDDDEIDLLGLFGTLLDHKLLIGGVTGLFCAAGVAYALLATPVYKANAVVQVEEKTAALPGLSDMTEMFGGESAAVTEIELIKSRAVIGKAVDNLRLDIVTEPHYLPLVGRFIARKFTPENAGEIASPLLGLNGYAWGGESLKVFQLEVPDALLEKELTLVAGENGNFTLLDPDDEILIEGEVGQLQERGTLKIQVESLQANAGTRFSIMRERRLTSIIRYQKDLEVSERGKDSGIIGLALEHDNPAQAMAVLDEVSQLYVRQNVERMSAEAANSLEFLRGQLPKVRKDLEAAENALNDYQRRSSSVDISLETKAVLDQTVALETQISELKLKQAEMDRKFTRQHPSYQALMTQLGELTQQQNSLTRAVKNLPETQQELLRLSRDVQVTTEIYTQLLNKTQELDVVRAGTVGNVRIIDEADVDVTAPVKPKKPLIVLIATLLGGFLAVAWVLIRRALNPGVESPDVIEQMGLPVYAAVPLSAQQHTIETQNAKAAKGKGKAAPLLAMTNPEDLAIESLRSLRTSLHFAMLEAANNRLMISGPSPGVGKSFISANLAAVIAQTGQKVLLVDVDMRKGHIHKVLGVDNDNGLSDLLIKRCDFEQAVRRTAVEGLFFIPRGQVPPNPSELLMHANFTAFLEEASKHFDMVILDTPPLLAVTDPAIVGRQAGTSLIVTRFGLNSAKEIEVTMRRFEQNGIELKGAIFNGVERRASAYGYGYGGYHYYQYEYKSDKA